VPQRRCIGCGRVRPKQELLRLAAKADRAVADPQSRLPGRGAYLCQDSDCAQKAQARGSASRALRRAVTLDLQTVESIG
jgi:predicted RNA-binding protein YlxR (DUF448 family)